MRIAAPWKGAARLAPFYALGLCLAAGLKLHYSRAGADDLVWILGPTSWITELLSGIHFEREIRVGFINHTHRMILEPACAGVNFLIAAFSMHFFSFVHRLDRSSVRGAWLAASVAVSYLLTVLTNSIRIVAAIHLRDMEIYGGAVTPDRVHRAAGAVVYCVSLLGAWLVADRFFDRLGARRALRAAPRALVPFGWYLAVALGAPLLNRAWRSDPARFAEHAAVVASICAILALACLLPRLARSHRREAPPR